MLSLLVLVLVNIILLLVLYQLSDLIFNFQAKSKSAKLSTYLTTAAFCGLFLLSLIITLGSAKLIANFLPAQKTSASAIVIDLDNQDCAKLLATIDSAKNNLNKLDNHRNIEDTSPLFTIKLEYQQGAKELREAAAKYQKINLTETGNIYSQKIIEKMQQKADYYEERTNLISDKEGTKKILQLLKQMDRVTQERETAIATIEQQCNLQRENI